MIKQVLRLGMVQMNSAVNDRDRNVREALARVDEACDLGADLVVLPEFFNTEYFAQYWDYEYTNYAEDEQGHTITALKAKAKERGVYICAAIYETEAPGLFFDTTFMIDRQGRVIGKYRKTHPAAMRSLEKIYFRGGAKYPVWDVEGFKVSSVICYDHCFPEAARSATVNGAEVILGPFATPTLDSVWKELMVTRAFENGVYMAPCNKVGQEDGWSFIGRSMVVDPNGDVLHEASRDSDEVFTVELEKEKIEAARVYQPFLRDRRPEIYNALVSHDEASRRLSN